IGAESAVGEVEFLDAGELSRGADARDLIEVEVDEVILEVRDGMKVPGGFGQVEGVAAMSRPLGDAYGGGAHGTKCLEGGVNQYGVGIDTAGWFELDKIGFQQDVASPDGAEMFYQQAAHGVVDGLVVGGHLEDGHARRHAAARLGCAAGEEGGAGGGGQPLASGEWLCHGSGPEEIGILWRCRQEHVQRGFRQCPAWQLGRRAVAIGQAAVGEEPDAQPVQCVGGAAFAEEAAGHIEGVLGFGGTNPAQGGERHAGSFGVGRGLIAECAYGTVIPAAALAHAPQQEPASLIDAPPNRRRGPAVHFLLERQNGQRGGSDPPRWPFWRSKRKCTAGPRRRFGGASIRDAGSCCGACARAAAGITVPYAHSAMRPRPTPKLPAWRSPPCAGFVPPKPSTPSMWPAASSANAAPPTH